MSKRLVFLLIPVFVLAAIYALFTRAWLIDHEERARVDSAVMEATAAFVEETFAEPEELETGVEELPEITVEPAITVTEFPGRRLVVSGQVSTSDERRTIVEAIRADVEGDFLLDDQAKLDYQCAGFSWLPAVDRIDFSLIKQVRRFRLTLSNGAVSVQGLARSDVDSRRVKEDLQRALPNGVVLESQIESAQPPMASLAVWSAPDSTILLSGSVPEGESEGYIQIVREAVPGARIVSDLLDDRFVSPPTWDAEIKEFLPGYLRTVQRGSFEIQEGRRVRIEGLAQADAISGLRRQLASSFPSPRFELELDLQLGVLAETKSKGSDPNTGDPSKVNEGLPLEGQSIVEMVESMKIFFRSGRSRVSQLKEDEKKKLDAFGQQWRREGFKGKVFVFGFTDRSGDKATNAYFSRTRCENVVSYLSKTYEIDRSYFEIVGTPENHSMETGIPSELRRVEFSLADVPSQPAVVDWSEERGAPSGLLKPINAQELFGQIGDITFSKGKVTPPLKFRRSLSQFGAAMAIERRTDVVIIYGFSDNKGSANANRWYTEERCKAVAQELTKVGVSEDQIVLRPVLPARTTGPADDGEDPEAPDPEEEEEGEESESPETNPRRVKLVLMTREAFDAAEAAARAAGPSETATENETTDENEDSSEPLEASPREGSPAPVLLDDSESIEAARPVDPETTGSPVSDGFADRSPAFE